MLLLHGAHHRTTERRLSPHVVGGIRFASSRGYPIPGISSLYEWPELAERWSPPLFGLEPHRGLSAVR